MIDRPTPIAPVRSLFREHACVALLVPRQSLEQVLDRLDTHSAYFWATHAGAELDCW